MKVVSWILVLSLGACVANMAFAQDGQVAAGAEQGGEVAASVADASDGPTSPQF